MGSGAVNSRLIIKEDFFFDFLSLCFDVRLSYVCNEQ